MHFAHTRQGAPESEWEPLHDHLAAVAERAGKFAEAFSAAEWGQIAGSWHDLGKYSTEFQTYLRSANGLDAHLESQPGKVDHSTAGAQHAVARCPGTSGHILAYCIAGHHGGLPNNIDVHGGQSGLVDRLQKLVFKYSAAPAQLLDQPRAAPPPLKWDSTDRARAFQAASFCRMLFSCLVDADFLATEAFMRPDQRDERQRALPTPADLLPHLDAHLESLQGKAADTPVNRARAAVLTQCRAAADLPLGFFSLTVPTGGGKTLSSLAFALRHAAQHHIRRVIYAIPFTSIIEQNVDVFREALATAGSEVVLEHHSNLDPEKETRESRLAAENWDAPLVVTTNVQLFESLFANLPSRCRKLHRIARCVIILDECQTLPVTLLAPTLRMLEELCRNYGCTVVLCSATQPAIADRPDFPIGVSGIREIVSNPSRLYESLKRVQVQSLGKLDDGALVSRLRQHEQVLCVVNTRGHAAKLFFALRDSLGSSENVFHLSAQMCAAHRTDVLNRIRGRLAPNNLMPCLVISTQLIEAGVDIDFPVVYRALAGLDSIAQAAGRCNREGRRICGQVFVFDTDVKPTHDVNRAAQIAAEVAGQHDDMLGVVAIEHFFRLGYWTRSGEWDKHGVLDCFALTGGGAHFQFREAAQKYQFIPDVQQPVIVPYDQRGRALIDKLRRLPEPPGRGFDRRLQRYVVGLYDYQLNRLRENQAIARYHERFWVLENDSAYDERIGLRLDIAGFDPNILFM